jgi:hypothetical protein
MGHGRLHSTLGSYLIPGIDFSPITRPTVKYRLCTLHQPAFSITGGNNPHHCNCATCLVSLSLVFSFGSWHFFSFTYKRTSRATVVKTDLIRIRSGKEIRACLFWSGLKSKAEKWLREEIAQCVFWTKWPNGLSETAHVIKFNFFTKNLYFFRSFISGCAPVKILLLIPPCWTSQRRPTPVLSSRYTCLHQRRLSNTSSSFGKNWVFQSRLDLIFSEQNSIRPYTRDFYR